MREKTLLKIAIIGALTGTLFLYILSENTKIEEKSLVGLERADTNTYIKMKGTIKDIKKEKNYITIKITKSEEAEIILYKKNKENITLRKGDYVEVIGKTSSGQPRIIGTKIRVIE